MSSSPHLRVHNTVAVISIDNNKNKNKNSEYSAGSPITKLAAGV